MSTKVLRDKVLAETDYRVGWHYQWEVATHVQAKEHMRQFGEPWSFEKRAQWIDTMLCTRSVSWQNKPMACPVCVESITEALKQGINPWAVPDSVRIMLKSLAARMPGGNTGGRHWHDKP